MKQCKECKREFLPNKFSRNQQYCNEECRQKHYKKYRRKYMRNYWKNHPNAYKKNNAQKIKREQKLRIEVYRLICNGQPKCACCGEAHIEFLTIDHIHGDGKIDRKTNGVGQKYYNWLLKNGIPEDIQILCLNCNWAKRFHKNKRFCPVHHPELY